MLLVFRRRSWLKGLYSTSVSHVSPFFRYSTAVSSSKPGDNDAAKPPHFNFIVDFLIHSVGFTRESALITSTKVPHLRCTKNPELVINIFKKYGLDNTHIKEIISCIPKILNCMPNKSLEPKLQVFKEYGFCGSDLTNFVKANPYLFRVGLHTGIIPAVDFIRKFVGDDEQAFEAIKKSKWLFSIISPANMKKLAVNVLQLQNRGLSDKQIVKVITAKSPWCGRINLLISEKQLVWIVEVLGIPENSPMFFHALTITTHQKSSIEKKMKIFRSNGWTKEEIATLVRTNPICLCYSEDKIRKGLNFFMKEVGYAPGFMATRVNLLTSSLEKTVRPRYKVLQMLKEKKLVGDRYHIALLIAYSKVNFLKFLKRFENELPGLVETYTSSIGKC